MLDMSTDLSPASYCSCLLSSAAGKLLYIQMISAMELIAVSFGRELKDVHQHALTHTHIHTYTLTDRHACKHRRTLKTMDRGSHHPGLAAWVFLPVTFSWVISSPLVQNGHSLLLSLIWAVFKELEGFFSFNFRPQIAQLFLKTFTCSILSLSFLLTVKTWSLFCKKLNDSHC